MKKLLAILILFAAFLCSGFIRVEAEVTGDVTLVNAFTRSEAPSGLKFLANTNAVGSVVEGHFVLAKGTRTRDYMITNYDNPSKTKDVNSGEPDGSGNFIVTVINYDEGDPTESQLTERYGKNVTVIAYVNVDGDIKFSDEVFTVSIADIARKEYNINTSPSDFTVDIVELTAIKVTHNDDSTNYYKTLASAISAGFADGDTLDLVRGDYFSDFTIDVDNFTLVGPNKNRGDFENRLEEANYTGVITIDAEIEDVEINGLKFSNQAQILSNCNSANASICYNLDGFNFKYNNVLSTLSSGDGFVFFDTAHGGGQYRYDRNISFEHNRFETLAGYSSEKFIYLCDNENVTFENNDIYNMRADFFYVQDYGKGLAGDFIFDHNEITNMYAGAMTININWIAHLTSNTYKVNITNNVFNSGNGTVYINFEQSNSSLMYNEFKINSNIFKGNTKVLWFDASIKSGAEFHDNTIYIVDGMVSVCKSDGYFGTGKTADNINSTQVDLSIDCSNTYKNTDETPYVMTAANKSSWFKLYRYNDTDRLVVGDDVD